MAVLYADTTAAFSTNPFKVVAASALDINCANGAVTAANSERLIAFTPSVAANCTEVMVALSVTSNTAAQSVTVELQKYVTGAWVTQAQKTLTYQQVIGTDQAEMSSAGMAIVSFVFDTGTYPVALTTDASTWRLRVLSTNASCRLCNHRTSGYCYVIPVVTAATYSATDSVAIKQDVVLTVDQTVTLTDIFAGVNSTFGNSAPAAAYTWTVTGYYYRSNNSVFVAGTSGVPVTYANKLTLAFTNQWATSFHWNGDTEYEDYVYGAYTTTYYSTLAADANPTQKVIVTSDDRSAVWQAGDTCWVWGASSSGIESKIIDTIVGTTVTFTTNLSGKHCDGWGVMNLTRVINAFGIAATGKLGGPGGSSGTTGASAFPNNFEYSGVYCTNATGIAINGYDPSGTAIGTGTRNVLIEHFVINAAGSIGVSIPTAARTSYANKQIYRYLWKNNSSGGCFEFRCDDATISNCYGGSYVNPITIGGTGLGNNLTVSNVQGTTTWSGSYGTIVITAVASTFTSCKCGSSGQGFKLGAVFNCTFTGCTSDSNATGGIYYNATSTGNRFVSCDFGSEAANGASIAYASGVLVQDVYDNCLFDPTIITSDTIGSMTLGSYLKLNTFDQTANDHRVYWVYGKSYSTGDSLSDTTVHTAGTGKFALRLRPISSTTTFNSYSFDVPTGNIQNKTMTVAVWCKINNATYYGATHQLPRLSIYYDNASTAYCQAAQNTDWQQLFVTFTPLTTYGQITVSLTGKTDATTTNADVYFDDFTVMYPPSVALDLGGMDYWANALPVVPPLAIPVSAYTIANAVWEDLQSSHVTAGTMGKQIKKALTFIKALL
jgi:hypothetical protein